MATPSLMNWTETFSGRVVDLMDIENSDLHIPDIIHNICKNRRFLGGTARGISIAEHSVNVSRIVELISWDVEHSVVSVAKKIALFHDGAEAYTGDIPGPYKSEFFMRRGFVEKSIVSIDKEITDWIYNKILVIKSAERLVEAARLVKKADLYCLAIERHDLLPNSKSDNWIGFDDIVKSSDFRSIKENIYYDPAELTESAIYRMFTLRMKAVGLANPEDYA